LKGNAKIQKELAKLADSQAAAFLQKFFKTSPGEYGEGDFFRGIRVPILRKLAREYQDLPLIMATFHFIKRAEFSETLKIAGMLVSDPEDLIHKAVGWMLREVGKRELKTEEHFLKAYYQRMPRTMLRYAIERFPEAKRQRYLKGKV